MADRITRTGMDFSKNILRFAGDVTAGTLEGVRSVLADSLEWSSNQLSGMARLPLIENGSFAGFLHENGEKLRKASAQTKEGLSQALEATAGAMQQALSALDMADDTVHRAMFENIHVSSIMGASFAGMVTTSTIVPSFRLNQKDAGATDVARDFQNSGCNHIAICVPGLFCDESLWENTGEPSLAEMMRAHGYYPVCLRFNPGSHISENGKALLALLEEFFALPELQSIRPVAVSYSQGGLILRSALYYAREDQSELPARIRHALFISCPDGGSYLEKLGFWLGLGLQYMPGIPLKLLGLVGNQRSPAIKDLSHGIIREEDWQNIEHTKRYGHDLYFGELDQIPATQIFSLLSTQSSDWTAWIGDGIVEQPSLTYLSDRVFRKQPNGENRVVCLPGKSHFEVLGADETRATLESILTDD